MSDGAMKAEQPGPEMSSDAVWADLRRRESNARTYARWLDRVLIHGDGLEVTDAQGRTYLDCLACAGALPLGHNHPAIREEVERFLRSGQLQQALDIATPAKLTFMAQLLRVLPQPFAATARIQFCSPSGSDAVEAALKLFKTATGRRSVLAFRGGYHGQTAGALSLMGNIAAKQAVSGLMSEVHLLPFPSDYRCPFGAGNGRSESLSLEYIERLLGDPQSGMTAPAAMVVEVVQGEGGCNPVSAAWLRGLREITRRHDVPLVIDEVQTGLGRTGHLFAHELAQIEPDALVLSKAIGGGYPLALVAYHERFDVWQPGAHSGTFRGNQIGFVAGAATMAHVHEHRLAAHARLMGERLRAGLLRIQAAQGLIGDVRGLGLMLGVEMLDLPALGPASAVAAAVKRAALEQGLIVETGGRDGAVVRFLPPLIITAAQVDEVLRRFGCAVQTVRAAADGQRTPPRPLTPVPAPAVEQPQPE